MTELANTGDLLPAEDQPLVDRTPQLLSENDDKRINSIAQKAVKGGFAPKGMTLEGAWCAIVYGLEIGLGPMAAMQNIAVINGRPSLFGDAGPALCKASGKMVGSPEEGFEGDKGDEDSLTAVCAVRRVGSDKPVKGTFSVKQAKAAGLWGKGNWAAYPRDMLMWKARWRAYRTAFPDVLKGLTFASEAEDSVIDVLPSNAPAGTKALDIESFAPEVKVNIPVPKDIKPPPQRASAGAAGAKAASTEVSGGADPSDTKGLRDELAALATKCDQLGVATEPVFEGVDILQCTEDELRAKCAVLRGRLERGQTKAKRTNEANA